MPDSDLPKPLLAPLAEAAIPAARNLLTHTLRTVVDPALLTLSVTLWRRIARSLPAGHSDGAEALSSLGIALRRRFEHAGDLEDLDDSVQAGRAALRNSPDDHPHRATFLSNVGTSFQVRYEHTGDLGDARASTPTPGRALTAVPSWTGWSRPTPLPSVPCATPVGVGPG
ncbi:hypothetical protein [Streptomyces sp. ISL-86]|uniref:hypothetical protein n=1 Tax=Streptomyces sp. ISL-86 TaxID=2819187 RepID=UPI001BE64E79|nr:hypothetical protein [Streptomyces sp. ISL-86]MBT2455569.1 hypothetical protein [Streptomyces sp. ISL-86]